MRQFGHLPRNICLVKRMKVVHNEDGWHLFLLPRNVWRKYIGKKEHKSPKFIFPPLFIPVLLKIFSLRTPFWLRKITTEPHILAHINTGRPEDSYPILFIFTRHFRQRRIRTGNIRSNDREHDDVLRINYKGRNLVGLAQLSFIIYGWINYATCFDPAFGSSSGFNKELSLQLL